MNVNKSSLTQMILTQLEEFRQAIYDGLGKARDAVFELMDAVLTSPTIQSLDISENSQHPSMTEFKPGKLHEKPTSVSTLK